MKQSPKQPAEKRCAQLIKAAGRIFAKKGYANATTEEIARTAGLTKGALYFHFKSKEDIFFAVVKNISERNTETILQHLKTESDPAIMLEKTIRSGFEFIGKEKYATAEFWEQAHKIPRIKNYFTDAHCDMRDKIVKFLNSHSQLKKKDCESLFTLLHAIIDGIIFRYKLGHCRVDLDKLADQVVLISKLYLHKDKFKMDKVC
jgi:AcrR family transcriptional regulator